MYAIIRPGLYNSPSLKDPSFYVMEWLSTFLFVPEKYFQLLYDLLH